MNFYKLVISYKGTHYHGWQEQEGLRTVQSVLRAALSRTLLVKDFNFFAASRTDKGVHAQRQVVRLDLKEELDEQRCLRKINNLLPLDIRILEFERTDNTFNPLVNIAKTYEFRFGKRYNPLLSDTVLFLEEDFDVQKMNQACELFMGEYDFKNFTTAEYTNSNRKVFSCKIVEESFEGKTYYKLIIAGDGFLKHMVRIIMGALLRVGRGKLTIEDLRKALTLEEKSQAARVEKAHGLSLVAVKFK